MQYKQYRICQDHIYHFNSELFQDCDHLETKIACGYIYENIYMIMLFYVNCVFLSFDMADIYATNSINLTEVKKSESKANCIYSLCH